jgi:hypothetical protein
MATITRSKTWVANETLTASDLNGEFANILTGVNSNSLNQANLSKTDDYTMGSLIVGTGITSTDGDSLHIHPSSAGTVTADPTGDELVIEKSTDVGMSFLCPASNSASIFFGDQPDPNVGSIVYAHGTDMAFTVETVEVLSLTSGDVNIPTNIGLTFATAEKIESDGTDLSITVGSGGDINLPASIGLTFGDDGEKIEGDGTNLVIESSALLTLTAGGNTVITNNALVSGTSTLTGLTTHGGNVISDTDSTDDLGTTSVRWANVYTDNIGDTGQDLTVLATTVNLPSGHVFDYNGADVTLTHSSNTLTVAGGTFAAAALTTSGVATLASLICTAGATFGGGIGSTGVTISTAGVIQANGAITSDGAVTGATLAGTVSTATQNSITAATALASVGTVTSGTWSTGAVIGGATMTLGSDATGDVYYRNASNVLTRLAVGSDADVLTLASGVPSWATPTVGDITGVTAGVGLSGGGTSGSVTLTLDLSELSAVTPTSGDSFSTLDNDGANEQRTTTDALATLFSGTGLTASSAVIGVDASQTQITGVGTITTGTWNATVIASAKLDADTAHLGVVQTFTGAKTFLTSITVGVNDAGHDVKFFGNAHSAYMLWDTSTDDLILGGAAKLGIGTASPGTKLVVNTGTNQNIMIRPGAGISGSVASGVGISASNDANSAAVNLTLDGDQIFFAIDETVKATINSAGIWEVVGIDLGTTGNRIDFNTANTTSIRANATGTLDFEILGNDRFQINAAGATFTSDNNSNTWLFNNANAAPYGIVVDFTAASPDNTSNYFMAFADSTTTRCLIYSDGDLQNHDNAYGAISDRNLKTSIVDARDYWDDWKLVPYRTFQMNDDVGQYGPETARRFGVVAQEMQEADVFGSLVTEDQNDGHLGFKYSVLAQIGGKVLQEAQDRIESLENEVNLLKEGLN